MPRIAAPAALVLALALVFAPLGLGASAASLPAAHSADGPITWSVAPLPTSTGDRAAFTYSVDPGTQISDSVVITNTGANPADFLVYATDATNDIDTGAFGLLKRDEKPVDVGGWITLNSSSLTIAPGQQATVPFTLLVPSDATPGDHVAGVVASVLTKGTENGSTVTLEQRVGARVYLSVTGTPKVGVAAVGLVSGFSPELNPFAPGTVSVSYDVKNTGNLRMDVTQSVTVTGPFGIQLAQFTPKPVKNLLPRQSVHSRISVPAVLGLFLASSTVTLVPGAVGSVVDPAAAAATDSTATPTPTPTPTPTASSLAGSIVDASAVQFVPVSSSVTTLAVSWTLLLMVLVLVAAIYLVGRYMTGTRERLYAAIDEASAAAREEALAASREPADKA